MYNFCCSKYNDVKHKICLNINIIDVDINSEKKIARRFSSKSSNTNFRSISLPSRTHPTTLRVEDELNKLKTFAEESSISNTSANTICSVLLGLQKLYKSIDDFVNLPLISQPLSHHQKEKWVDEVLDKSVRFLDNCGIAKDIVLQCKENVRDLQSSLRRKKGLEESIEKYFSFRRKLIKKDMKRSVSCLKQIDQEINDSDPTIMELDHHVSLVIRLHKEANSTSTMIFQLVLKFLSAESSKQKTNRWTILVQKGRFGSTEDEKKESFNELENVDAALFKLIDQNKMIQPHIVHNRLQNLEGSLERLENELEALCRCLIRSRTTLLNVFSC